MTSFPAGHYFSDEVVRQWAGIADKHRLRDEQFLRVLSRWLRPGSVLEIGAATGHLSEILAGRGYDVLASDYSPAFITAMRSRGLRTTVVDATANIREQTGSTFANMLAQNVLPLVWRDKAIVTSTLQAIHEALEPQGRLICISAHPRWGRYSQTYFTPREQIDIARATGLFRILATFPHQVIPTGWYRSWNAKLFNLIDFHAAPVVSIRLVWVMEKIRSREDADGAEGIKAIPRV